MQTPESSIMHTPDTVPTTEEQIRNREIEFKPTLKDDIEAPAIGIMAITAIFLFVVVVFSIFSSTAQPPVHRSTPAIESRIEPISPFPTAMPLPNTGPTPAPVPQN
jgi:hypothetical protein